MLYAVEERVESLEMWLAGVSSTVHKWFRKFAWAIVEMQEEKNRGTKKERENRRNHSFTGWWAQGILKTMYDRRRERVIKSL